MREPVWLEGAPSARDLGGLVMADGRRIRPGRLVRSGALGRLTDRDVATLDAVGLACLVDLRGPKEIEIGPPSRLPLADRLVVAAPVHDDEHPVFTYVTAVLWEDDLGAYGALAEEGTPAAMRAIYRWFVEDAGNSASFGAAVRALARPGHLPALYHCSVGKDRTGWLTVIVLTMLGADQATIRADYLATNRLTAKAQAHLLDLVRQRRPGVDLDPVRPVLEAREEYLDAAYAEVDRVYGTFEDYLRVGLGLDGGVRDALRAELLE